VLLLAVAVVVMVSMMMVTVVVMGGGGSAHACCWQEFAVGRGGAAIVGYMVTGRGCVVSAEAAASNLQRVEKTPRRP
jgi:hypothetical protein